MSKNEQDYDKASKTMRIFRSFAKPKTLVPPDELKQWIDALQSGKGPDGQAIKHVHYVFEDEQSADYNHQALSFAGVATEVGTKSRHSPFKPADGEPSFSTREDFGID
ncbi:MAG: hypothetical protein H0U74_11850 [Bradymonadaceae bacterium]|nr:hypothetical protein [Lujinxingiaceae bacterium]